MKPIFPESPQDWTNTTPTRIYYNSKTESYTSTVLADVEVISEEEFLEKSKTYFPSFVKNVLINLNKVGDTLEDIVEDVSIQGTFIDPSPLILQKILLSIPASSVEDIRELPEKNTDSYKGVVYDLQSFFTKISNVSKKFEDYQKQMVSNIFNKNGSALYTVDFVAESSALYEISSNIIALIESNNLSVKNYSKIEISYSSEEVIQCIKLVDGIDSVELKYLFEDFIKSYPQDRAQTVRFLYNLPTLSDDIYSGFITYEDIIKKYMAAQVNKRQNNIDIRDRSLNKGSSTATNNNDVSKNFDSLKNISKKSVGILQQEILKSVYSTPCVTPAEKEEIDDKLERESGKKANFANKLTLSVGDAFFNSLPEVLQRVADKQGEDAKEALNDLGTNVLNRLGVCGIGDLTSLVTNTVFAYIDEQEYADELSKCAVKNLDNNKLEKLWQGIQRFGKNTEIVEKYRKIVGDTILPWNTGGYLPPDYQKGLRTDEPLDKKYTLKIPTSEQDTDIQLRGRAFKDSIAGTIDGRDLLNIMVNSFPDEMGWLSFFTDMTKGILKKCNVPSPAANLSWEANWCQKRVHWPKFQDIHKSNASLSFKPSTISTILIEEIKNIVINLTVSTVIASMKQIFEIISAGASFDSDYFKQNQFIPDLFQPSDDMQFQIASNCGDTSENYKITNESVREVFYENYRQTSVTNKMSIEDIDKFLKSSSVALSRYDKIRLYNGEAGPTTYDKVLSLVKGTPVSAYLGNYYDVEQIFLSIAGLMNVNNIEESFYQTVREPVPSSVAYCGKLPDSLDRGYFRNKPTITPEQVEQMKQALKDIQKDKICFAAETLGNPKGAIIGQLGEILQSKNGPIFGRIAKEMTKLFEPAIERKMDTISKNYRNDLYKARGLFDLIMVNESGIGKNRRELSSFFGILSTASTPMSMENTRISDSTYTPQKLSENIVLTFLKGSASSSTKDKPWFNPDFESGSEKIQSLLIKNQAVLKDNLNQRISENFINNGVLTDIVEGYFKDIRDKLENRTYGPSWEDIYNNTRFMKKTNENGEYIAGLLGEQKITEDAKRLYSVMDAFDEDYKYVPFNALKSKEEATLAYAEFLMLVHVITSEILIKNLPIYEALGAELLYEFDYLGNYIYNKFIDTIDDFSTDGGQIKVLEKLVQTTLIISNAFDSEDEKLISSIPTELSSNIDNLNKNIANWIRGSRGNKVKNLEENRGDIEAITKFFVKESAKKYITEFQEGMAVIENNKFPSINKTNTIYNYILNESLLSSAVDVVSDPNNVEIMEMGLRLEKYIILNGADTGLPSGVQNLEKFQQYLVDNPISGNIADNWSSWSFGMRISSVYDFSKAGVLQSEISLNLRDASKAFILISNSDDPEAERYFLSPLVVYEKEIPNQIVSSQIINNYDADSMKKGLSEISDFLNFYYRGMNIENLMSLATIYINEEFKTFLTNESDLVSTVTAGAVVPPSTVEIWNNGGMKVLNDTKRFIVNNLERI